MPRIEKFILCVVQLLVNNALLRSAHANRGTDGGTDRGADGGTDGRTDRSTDSGTDGGTEISTDRGTAGVQTEI